MCSLQGGSIVGAIARDSYHLATALQRLHQALLVHRPCTCDDDDVARMLLQLIIRHRGHFRTCIDVPLRKMGRLRQQSYLPCYLGGCRWSVARDDLHADARFKTFAHSGRDILAHRVSNSYQSIQHRQALINSMSKRQCTQSTLLPSGQ